MPLINRDAWWSDPSADLLVLGLRQRARLIGWDVVSAVSDHETMRLECRTLVGNGRYVVSIPRHWFSTDQYGQIVQTFCHRLFIGHDPT